MTQQMALDVAALDPEFNGNGRIELDWEGGAASITQRDGKIALMAGRDGRFVGLLVDDSGNPILESGKPWTVEDRFSDDPAYVTNGQKMTELSTGHFLVEGTVDQYRLDGIVYTYRAFAWYDRHGALAPTFGKQGKYIVDDWEVLAQPMPGALKKLRTQATMAPSLVLDDGSVVFTVGKGLAKLTPRGTLDLSFGSGGGLATLGDPPYPFFSASVCVHGDGSITVDGAFAINDTAFRGGAVRLDKNGQIDTRFGEQGWFLDYKAPERPAVVILAQPDGEVILAGPDSSSELCVVVSVDGQGRYTPAFNGGEPLVQGISQNCAWLRGQSDQQGHFVLGGVSAEEQPLMAVLGGFDRNGEADQRFGPDGWVRGLPGLLINSLVVQPDGRILLAVLDLEHLPFKPLYLRVMGTYQRPA